MDISTLKQAQKDLEKITDEVRYERQHHSAQVAPIAIAGTILMGYAANALLGSPKIDGVLVAPLLVQAVSLPYFMRDYVRTGQLLLSTLGIKPVPKPVIEVINEDSVMVHPYGGKTIIYDTIPLVVTPEAYLRGQLRAHQELCDRLEPEVSRMQQSVPDLSGDLLTLKRLVSLKENPRWALLKAKARFAPREWLRGTTKYRGLVQLAQDVKTVMYYYKALSLALEYGAEFFAGVTNSPLTATLCCRLADKGRILAQRAVESSTNGLSTIQEIEHILYPKDEKLHRWLPL